MIRPVPKKATTKKRKLTHQQLIKKADRVFSEFIRNRDATQLKGLCCTCGKPASQAGHFIKRSYKSVRWNPSNVHAQCVRCNHFLDGNESSYALFIVNRYGVDKLKWLLEQKTVTHKPTREELEKIILAYS